MRIRNPNHFEAGTLAIDIIDSRTYELPKHAHATRLIVPDATPAIRQARIQDAVNAVLKDLRIKH
ncbi:MAG: hypothetical protein EPO07_05805 [Verrucomicrobia bacterium]|nr:MAG: hypothetical protein EPO07_05805 [Verrucomicrobiota bacterium]